MSASYSKAFLINLSRFDEFFFNLQTLIIMGASLCNCKKSSDNNEEFNRTKEKSEVENLLFEVGQDISAAAQYTPLVSVALGKINAYLIKNGRKPVPKSDTAITVQQPEALI